MSASTTYSDSPTPQPQPFQSYSDATQLQPSTSQATTTVVASTSSTAHQPQTRQAAEEARKDRTLAEFLLMLDEYEPLVHRFSSSRRPNLDSPISQIPNEVTDYYLQRVGFDCEDVRLCVDSSIAHYMHAHARFVSRKRLLSLAAQKFVSDIASDAYQHARIRTNAAGGRARAAVSGPGAAKVCLLPTLFPLTHS